jgi:hypothetical protein
LGDLGGASYKVIADASSFMKTMTESEKQAQKSFKTISAASEDAADSYELVGAAYEVGARRAESALDKHTLAAKRAEAALDKQTKAAVEATQAQKLMSQMLDGTAAAENRMATAANTAAAAMAQSNARLAAGATASTVAIAGAGNASRSSALGFLYLSQAIEDAQYGFSAIVNNIPMIVMAMGGTGGLAGAVSILAVGANIALNHWESLANVLRSGAEREAAEQMAVLADRTEKAVAAFEHLKNAKTKSEKASGGALAEGITEAPGGAKNFQKRLSEALVAMGQAPTVTLSFAEQAKLAATAMAMEMVGEGGGREFIEKEIEKKKAGALADKSADLIQRASEGDKNARSTIAAIMKRQPEAFTKEQKEAFEKSSPEAIKKKEEIKDLGAERHAEKEIGDAQTKEANRIKKAVEDKQRADKDQARDAKQQRIQALEDQRSEVIERHHVEDLRLERAKEQLGGSTQMLQGPKAVKDYYQKAAGDDPLVKLAREQKDIQEKQRQELVQINKQLEKERRVRPN